MVVFIPLSTSPTSKHLQVCPGKQGGYHAANPWDIIIQPIRSVTLIRGTVMALDVIDGGGTRISRLFQPGVIRRGSGPNREVECLFWAVVQGRAGLQAWVLSIVPFVQVRPPSTHNRLLLCSIGALGQLQRWKQCGWRDVRAIAPTPHLKEAAQVFLLRFLKQLLKKGPKGEKGDKAGSHLSANLSLQRKGCTEQQSRGSTTGALAPRPPPRRQHRQRRQRETGGGGKKAEILRLEAENKLLREQLKAAEAARRTAQEALSGERAAWERREKG